MIKCLHGVPIEFDCADCGTEKRVPPTYQDLENDCKRLYGEKEELIHYQQTLMDQCVKFEKQIDRMMTTMDDLAATIRRLTEERLGPEKSLYEQAKGLGTGLAPAPVSRGHTFGADGVCQICGCRAIDIGMMPPCEGPRD